MCLYLHKEVVGKWCGWAELVLFLFLPRGKFQLFSAILKIEMFVWKLKYFQPKSRNISVFIKFSNKILKFSMESRHFGKNWFVKNPIFHQKQFWQKMFNQSYIYYIYIIHNTCFLKKMLKNNTNVTNEFGLTIYLYMHKQGSLSSFYQQGSYALPFQIS